MALLKAGKIWYNGTPKQAYILVGVAARNAEDAPINGKEHAKVSVAAGETENGDSLFVTVNGWRARARDVMTVLKGNAVLAFGAMKIREYNGRNYYDLDCDFIATSGQSWPASKPVFAELDDDEAADEGYPWDNPAPAGEEDDLPL